MTKVRYGDLTEEDRALVCNGCGGKGSWVPVPDFMFEASCDQHDFNYWLGCTEKDRAKADGQFYAAMVRDANRTPWWKRPVCRALAWIYYKTVRAFAAKYFYHGPEERTLEDLEAIRRASR